MKKHLKITLLLILVCMLLPCCSKSSTDPHIISEGSKNCPISTLRTGTERQGIKTLMNGFECTDTGVYFMCHDFTNTWLLYSDHNSDEIIKLCGRPDCNHDGKDCNAYFDSAINICYYDGFLYTYDEKNDTIIRMNLDGTEREAIYELEPFMKKK